jgi:hypothetical protein
VPRVELSSIWDVVVGGFIGYVTGGPGGAVAGALAAAAADPSGGGSGSGGFFGGFEPCYPVGPCIGNGIYVGNTELGVMAQICYPGGLRTVPCSKAVTVVGSIGRI